jgi:hypothetical protein
LKAHQRCGDRLGSSQKRDGSRRETGGEERQFLRAPALRASRRWRETEEKRVGEIGENW